MNHSLAPFDPGILDTLGHQGMLERFNLERGLWIIPPQNVKQIQNEMRKKGKRLQDVPPYIVPLSIQANEIARYLLDEMKPAQVHLLAHRSDLKKRIS